MPNHFRPTNRNAGSRTPVEKRRAEFESDLARLGNENHDGQIRTIALMRTQLGADDIGIPSTNHGIAAVRHRARREPFRMVVCMTPTSPLRSVIEQFIADAELTRRLIDNPTSEILPFSVHKCS
ncbi:hypothetical protein ACFWU5_22745 [Nocardia sp. NPDC058640]|uniref:hypothetical protein n=1 Tax=Nocardia sp. NPDC058640 TaxID=3346571 RepID=UPI0036616025